MSNDIRFYTKSEYSNSHAIIIGIDNYSKTNPLSYAVSDAEAIRETLINKLNFPSNNIIYLKDSEATKTNILTSLLRFVNNHINLDDRILFFFAGHGHTFPSFKGEIGFLVPHDADISNLATLIRWDELTRNSELIKAKHMLFIMDACYGGLALTRATQAGSTRFLKDMMHRYSRQVLTAGKANQVVSDAGGPLPNHSVFTGHLINGINGDAVLNDGILTASGLMSYVYTKVANDISSNQTPHYGHYSGDGDFIFYTNQLDKSEESGNIDIDRFISIPSTYTDLSGDELPDKIIHLKSLLSGEQTYIELHDYMMKETREFLSSTGVDYFDTQTPFSTEELLERISRYEEKSNCLMSLLSCMSYWAKPAHIQIINKIFGRIAENIGQESGLTAWSNLRWYPLIALLYCTGIAATAAKRYDVIANLFYSKIPKHGHANSSHTTIEAFDDAISTLLDEGIFKKIPGNERLYTPMSDYLCKLLQPKLDDLLFLGKGYDSTFDEFEILLGFATADINHANSGHAWGLIGRFGWKGRRQNNSPLNAFISDAQSLGKDWAPVKAGLYGGDINRFNNVLDKFLSIINKQGWR